MTIARELDIILAHGPELSAGGLDYYKLGLWAARPAQQPHPVSQPRPAPGGTGTPVAGLPARRPAPHGAGGRPGPPSPGPAHPPVVDRGYAGQPRAHLGGGSPGGLGLPGPRGLQHHGASSHRDERLHDHPGAAHYHPGVAGDLPGPGVGRLLCSPQGRRGSGRSGLSGHSGLSRPGAVALAPRRRPGPALGGGAARFDQPGPVPPRHPTPAPDPPGGGAGQRRKFPGAAPDPRSGPGRKSGGHDPGAGVESGAPRGRGGGGLPPPDSHPVPTGGPAGCPGGGRPP